MKKFVVKRVLLSIVILFFVSMIIYAIMRCMPSSFVEQQALTLSQRPGAKSYDEWVAQLNASYGLDTGVIQGYFRWAAKAVRGQFGDSWYFNQPVLTKFASVIWYSFAARKQYSATDYTITVIALVGISLPSFFVATLLKWVFSVKLGWFDLYGIVGRNFQSLSSGRQILDMAWHLVLPVITLTIVSIGSLMRYTRTNMLEVLNADYIRTARAKGLPEKRVIHYHAFRNILIPIITLLGGTLPGLFSGAMVTETLFQIPGIGYTSYQAVLQGDIPFVMFYMLFSAVLILLGNLIADILYAVVDPRVRVN